MTQVAIKVPEAVYQEKSLLWCNEHFEYVLPVGHIRISNLRDPDFTVLTEFFLNDHLTGSLRTAQDTIEVFKVLFPTKALINGKSSEHNKRFWKIFEEELFCRHLDRNFLTNKGLK